MVVWYDWSMSELTVITRDDLVYWSMTEIEVDGIKSKTKKPYGNYFFSVKEDAHPLEATEAEYLGSHGTAMWNSPHSVRDEVSYKYGEIDEELWLKKGFVVAVDYPKKSDFLFYA
jgi:hypothetical protein